MIRLARRAVGQLRSIRGRCPSCNSEGTAARSCPTCHGHQGPFPVSEATQARWMARFERGIPAQAQAGASVARTAEVVAATS